MNCRMAFEDLDIAARRQTRPLLRASKVRLEITDAIADLMLVGILIRDDGIPETKAKAGDIVCCFRCEPDLITAQTCLSRDDPPIAYYRIREGPETLTEALPRKASFSKGLGLGQAIFSSIILGAKLLRLMAVPRGQFRSRGVLCIHARERRLRRLAPTEGVERAHRSAPPSSEGDGRKDEANTAGVNAAGTNLWGFFGTFSDELRASAAFRAKSATVRFSRTVSMLLISPRKMVGARGFEPPTPSPPD